MLAIAVILGGDERTKNEGGTKRERLAIIC